MADHISLAHGNGGRLMRELIRNTIAKYLGDVLLDIVNDATAIPADETHNATLCITTDAFTVKPVEFPGGDIGSLAVHGTVNDLAVSGATPEYISVSLILEEGLEIALLQRILASMRVAAIEANIAIACGDTKVVPRGEGSGIYITTTGIGQRNNDIRLSFERIAVGDQVLISGPVGDHGIAVMLAREQFGLRGDVQSDATSVLPLTLPVRHLPGLRFMRDPTRGGLATVLHEILHATGLGVRLQEQQVPVRDAVQSVCDMLGYDPYYLACEGRVVAIADRAASEIILHKWHSQPDGTQAAIIGEITDEQHIVLTTALGGERILEELEDEPLPRIC